jgi:hypothetical protein
MSEPLKPPGHACACPHRGCCERSQPTDAEIEAAWQKHRRNVIGSGQSPLMHNTEFKDAVRELLGEAPQ